MLTNIYFIHYKQYVFKKGHLELSQLMSLILRGNNKSQYLLSVYYVRWMHRKNNNQYLLSIYDISDNILTFLILIKIL